LSPIRLLKAEKRALIDKHAQPDNFRGSVQILNTLLPLAALWIGVAFTLSYFLSAALTVVMALVLVRVFALMHDAGHGSLFRGRKLNQVAGFFLGVIAGMPQYVWSQHHAFHHATNGNWAKYRGPFAVITVEAYVRLSEGQRRNYRRARHILMLPLAGFMYLLFNPRYTWLMGSLQMLAHVLRGGKLADFKTRYWATAAEYRHMTWNNLVLLQSWAAMSWAIGPALFFTVYVASVSLAAAIGIILFTVQHNFEEAYASADEGWDYDTAAVEGTSFLVLPRWLNWFTADIGYHHVHHISATIPNYRLAACHAEYEHLFGGVRRLRLADIPVALKCILWDEQSRAIVSVAQVEHRAPQPA
jgi:acyl-lipid omega-6 desaturase (Delta-12 desaturase)